MAQRMMLIWAFAMSVFLPSCSVTPEYHREARLMPPEIAKQIVAKHFGNAWAQAPFAYPEPYLNASVRLFCGDDWTKRYSMPYSDIRVVWDSVTLVVDARSLSQKVAFSCGTMIRFPVKVSSVEEMDDLVDALISLGATVAVR